MKKSSPLHWQIIISMGLGLAVGLLLIATGNGQISNDWIKPFGTMFINGLKLIAVPLVLFSLIRGISNLADISQLSSMGGRTMGLYLFTTVTAILLGLLIVNVIRPGESFPPETRQEFSQNYANAASKNTEVAQSVKQQGPLQPLIDVVPENVVASFSNNRNMLQIIAFALLFGVAMVMLPFDTIAPIKKAVDALDEIIIQMVHILMKAAPIGVFALLTSLLVDIAGNDPQKALELLSVLAWYSISVLIGLALMIAVVYPLLIRLFAQFDYKDFLKGIAPAQMMAFSTSSSAATLPVTFQQVEEELGVSNETASFVLPLGATINMDGTSLYQAVAAVFIAQAYGLDLTLGQQMGIVVTATLASIGTAAVPGAGMVMLVIVLEQAKIPVEGIALILAPDRILDMCRTVVNVTGDASVCMIIDKWRKKKVALMAEA